MGNSTLTVRVAVTIASYFMDFKTEKLFSESARDDTVEALTAILGNIDWTKIDFSSIRWDKINEMFHQQQPKRLLHKMKESIWAKEKNDHTQSDKKGKQKTPKEPEKISKKEKRQNGFSQSKKFRKMNQKALEENIRNIITQIRVFNEDKNPYNKIDQYTWAVVCKLMVQNSDLVNINFQEERVVYRIFVKHIINVFSKAKQEKITESDLFTQQFQNTLFNFLGELEKQNKINEVAIIHNYIHLGYQGLNECSYFQSNNIAMLFSSSLLFGLDRANHSIDIPPVVYRKFPNFMEALLIHPLFANPYSNKMYQAYGQERHDYEIELKELWENNLPDSLIRSLMVTVEPLEERKGIFKLLARPFYNKGRKIPTGHVERVPVILRADLNVISGSVILERKRKPENEDEWEGEGEGEGLQPESQRVNTQKSLSMIDKTQIHKNPKKHEETASSDSEELESENGEENLSYNPLNAQDLNKKLGGISSLEVAHLATADGTGLAINFARMQLRSTQSETPPPSSNRHRI